MNILESSQNLIDKVLNVVNSDGLFRVNDSMQIGFHQILNDVNILKLLYGGWWWDKVNDSNHILMIEYSHQLDLP